MRCKNSKGVLKTIVVSVLCSAMLLVSTMSLTGCSDISLPWQEEDSIDWDALAVQRVTSDADVPVSETDAQDVSAVHEDHEDVFEADYVSDYYIVVYVDNSCVLVLKKDEFGKYTVPEHCFLCSAGSPQAPTDGGVYPVWRKYEWRFMMEVYGHYCSGFGYNTGYLFHSVPYSKDDNSCLGSGYKYLGTNVSHGCVRLCARDAKWIYDNVPVGTLVHVLHGKNGPKAEPVQKQKMDEYYYFGWDPTDPDPKNPYNKRPVSNPEYFSQSGIDEDD